MLQFQIWSSFKYLTIPYVDILSPSQTSAATHISPQGDCVRFFPAPRLPRDRSGDVRARLRLLSIFRTDISPLFSENPFNYDMNDLGKRALFAANFFPLGF